jgi:hypothetical protein
MPCRMRSGPIFGEVVLYIHRQMSLVVIWADYEVYELLSQSN